MHPDNVEMPQAPVDAASASKSEPDPENQHPAAANSIDINDLLAALKRIEALLAEQSAEVFCRDSAARFIGVSPATLDRLASANPALRPVRVSVGRVVWRRADLRAFLDGLKSQ